jgi:hypothetical protein
VQAYLDLQQVIAANALVVHLVVGIISIAAALVFDESKPAGLLEPGACAQGRKHSQARRGGARGRDVAADEAAVPWSVLEMADVECDAERAAKGGWRCRLARERWGRREAGGARANGRRG